MIKLSQLSALAIVLGVNSKNSVKWLNKDKVLAKDDQVFKVFGMIGMVLFLAGWAGIV